MIVYAYPVQDFETLKKGCRYRAEQRLTQAPFAEGDDPNAERTLYANVTDDSGNTIKIPLDFVYLEEDE